jgi:chaperonin GroES
MSTQGIDLKQSLNEVNIADHLEEDQLIKIGKDCARGFKSDRDSRKEWEDNLEKWTKLALQITEKKTYPWENASNVKFPLLSTASMQFAARAYPTLVPANGDVVKCKVVGSDPTGEKEARAIRVSKHMSYQVMQEMDEWEEEMDRLLIALPISGTVFKKTYWDKAKQRNCSMLIYPKNLVVNYWAKSLELAERKTEIIEMPKRILREKQLAKIYLDKELGDPSINKIETNGSNPSGTKPGEDDETTPYIICEQHTFLDLDEDGYPEPYIVIFEESTETILRISPRYSEEGISLNDKGDVQKIEPIEYYTKFSFFPNPDGGFYDIGFGRLLGSINHSVDTLINQLIDAGTLSNLQSGFIGKGLRIKMGDSKFTPGEWKAVNATGSDIKSQIFPLPVRDPSNVLFQLLELLSTSAKELSSISEVNVGKMPGQNTPATTTMASIQEGQRLFTAVYKRIYRSLAEEFRKLYKLNAEYLDPQEEIDVLDEPIKQSDYQGNPNDIVPSADPNASSQETRVANAERLTQLLSLGTINPQEVTQRILLAYEEPNIEKLMGNLPPPPPDPKMEALKLKGQLDQQKFEFDKQMKILDFKIKQADEQGKQQLEAEKVQAQLKNDAISSYIGQQIEAANASQQMSQSADAHNQKMQQTHEMHQVKKAQAAKPQGGA